jgi:hypothetical protein
VSDDYEEIPAIQAGKRCGVQWTPWMGDWFTSWSPHNDNNNAEGQWDQWVDLALKVLQDPLTAIVRPAAHAAVKDVPTCDFYTGANVDLTAEQLTARFRPVAGSQEGTGAATGGAE